MRPVISKNMTKILLTALSMILYVLSMLMTAFGVIGITVMIVSWLTPTPGITVIFGIISVILVSVGAIGTQLIIRLWDKIYNM